MKKYQLPAVGQTRGNLTVAAIMPRRHADMPDRLWCFCSCGGEILIAHSKWRGTIGLHCGCNVANKRVKHGNSKRPEYRAWLGMLRRCNDKKNRAFANYGGRGIAISQDWMSFYKFIEDMGPRPGPKFSVDRIDVDGDYCKENCRWANWIQQGNNRRNNVRITGFGKTQTLTQWSRELKMTRRKLAARLRHFPLEQCLIVTRKQVLLLNKKPLKLYDFSSRQVTAEQWSNETGLAVATLQRRLTRGNSLADALSPINRRRNIQIEYLGKTKTLHAWCIELGLDYARTIARFRRGRDIADVFKKENLQSLIIYNNEQKTISEWCRVLDLKYCTVAMRLRRGLPVAQAFVRGDLRRARDA